MKFFLDTANIQHIQNLAPTGLIDGITTNPTLLAKESESLEDFIRTITPFIKGHISVEVIAETVDDMLLQAEKLHLLSEQICIKLPLTKNGLSACYQLNKNNIPTNVTLCFTPQQALLAAKAGATYVSPFIGRLDDIGLDGITLIEEIRTIYNQYEFSTQILAASIRTINHVKDVAMLGADVATIPPHLFDALIAHPLTTKGIEIFNQDWAKNKKSF